MSTCALVGLLAVLALPISTEQRQASVDGQQVERVPVEFLSEGAVLRGRFFVAVGPAPATTLLKRAGAPDVTFLVYHDDHAFRQVRERLATDIQSWLRRDRRN